MIIHRVKLRKLVLSLITSAFSFCAWAQSDEAALKAIADHRKEQEAEFRNPLKSPLEKKERKRFKGLKYYAPDLKYRINAKFVKNETPVLFKMKTTTTRLPDYVKYGEVHFTLEGREYILEVYQNPELSRNPAYKNYLFIPFTDETNGKETYDVGRYIDFNIPSSEDVVIDFNVCYNPSCSYRAGFSCPIPPAANHLPLEILAGEKKYHEHH